MGMRSRERRKVRRNKSRGALLTTRRRGGRLADIRTGYVFRLQYCAHTGLNLIYPSSKLHLPEDLQHALHLSSCIDRALHGHHVSLLGPSDHHSCRETLKFPLDSEYCGRRPLISSSSNATNPSKPRPSWGPLRSCPQLYDLISRGAPTEGEVSVQLQHLVELHRGARRRGPYQVYLAPLSVCR